MVTQLTFAACFTKARKLLQRAGEKSKGMRAEWAAVHALLRGNALSKEESARWFVY